MFMRSIRHQSTAIVIATVIFLQACVQTNLTPPTLPTPRDIEPVSTEIQHVVSSTTPFSVLEMPTVAVTEAAATERSLPTVTISAIKGNLFIRRGPDMAFNPIGILYKDTTVDVVARDVLFDWVQIIIPGSDVMGWVSVQTEYSKIVGELSSLPEVTPTDWPQPAYLRNCSYHQMYILPGEIKLSPLPAYPENEVWLYPGTYTVYDLDVPGEPDILQVDIREGSDIEILKDGLGNKHKCP